MRSDRGEAHWVTMTTGQLERVRRICTGFPDVTERESHGAPTWFVRDRRAFVTFWVDGHHDQAFPHVWCDAPPGAQEALIETDPVRYFRPPYVGHRGWVGMRMDGPIDWDGVELRCAEAHATATAALGGRRRSPTKEA